MTPASFVEELAKVSLPRVFNPYADTCPEADDKQSASIRCRNLIEYLEAASSRRPPLWVARDLGYRGGRRTGIALTDESCLPVLNDVWGLRLAKATRGAVVSERTARVVWRLVIEMPQPPFLWNVFPFHPHEPGNGMTNRQHSANERRLGLVFLNSISEILDPQIVVAIGNDAERALGEEDGKVFKVRHPSYGGESAFIAGIRQFK